MPIYDLTGNTLKVDGITLNSGSTASTSTPVIYTGAGAPSFAAAQGSLYLNTTGSTTSTRLYVNTTGASTWTNFTSAA